MDQEVKPNGVSIGWFDTAQMHEDLGRFLRKVKRVMPDVAPAWPLSVSSIKRQGQGTGVAYCFVKGMIPIHIDTISPHDSDGRIWQLVLEVRNRPCLLTAGAGGSEVNDRRSETVLGIADGQHPFAMGALELCAGMAVHFDITTHWHGVSQLPHGKDVNEVAPPLAIIMQVSGFGKEQLGLALEKAKAYISLDRGFWDRGL